MVRINELKEFYQKHNINFYLSLLGPLIMGTIHLISMLIHYDYIVLNYAIFCCLILLIKVWQWAIERFNLKLNPYIAGIISVILILAPMMASIILTILYRNAIHYPFDWFIYAYALYGTVKMTMAIIKLAKRCKKTKRTIVISWIGIISASYTIQMMEFQLITTFNENGIDDVMHTMMKFTQGVIFILSLFVLGLFIKKYIEEIRYNN